MTAFPRPIALVGMPAAGKSTVGPLIATALGLPFADLDALIEARTGMAVADIFATQGEPAFRAIERDTVAGLLAEGPCVVALGGGAFVNPETRGLVRRGARTLWLRTDLETLSRRVGDGAGRPLLAGDPKAALARLEAARAAAYAEADHVVDAGAEPSRVASAALLALSDPPAAGRVPVGGDDPYEVLIGPGLLDEAGPRIAALGQGFRRAVIVADTTTDALFGNRVAASLAVAGIAPERIAVPPGEASKSWAGLQSLVERFAALGLARRDLVVALGGGVVGDLAGFAAAIYMRGLSWAQLPTTLLAQVDSSVGGKTAIDLSAGKNLAGAFWNPAIVLADTAALATLPPREVRAGWAEVLKYGLLGDARFFAWLEANQASALAGDADTLASAIAHSVRMKAAIVTEDAREGGIRAHLNLGHTFAHAFEAETGFGPELLHGEAVAIGMALAFRFSAAQGLCPETDAARVEAALRAAGLPAALADLPRQHSADALVARMRGDKKAGSGGALTLVLARGVGQAFVAEGVDAERLGAFLRVAGAA